MLGWHISVYRLTDGGNQRPTADAETGARLAVWQTGTDGLCWLDELVRAKEAVDLGGDGYPYRYTALAGTLLPQILGDIPDARNPWLSDPGDVLTKEWLGETTVDHATAAHCRSVEWLLVEAWDES